VVHSDISILKNIFLFTSCILLLTGALTGATAKSSGESPPQSERIASVHAGFLYPNGVDIIGYTVEHNLKNNFHGYYTFGFPSLAAVGVTYYSDYNGNGLTATLGVGIGSVFYTSLAYQLRLTERHYLKLGGGYATGIAYTGLYPSLSYEFRLK